MIPARNDAADAPGAYGFATARLRLAPLAPEHVAPLHPLLADWEVVRMLAVVPWPLPLAEMQAHVTRSASPDAEMLDFAMLLDGAPIGVCTVKQPGLGNPPRVMPRFGYWLGRPYWGRGYATEALGALVGFAFAQYRAEVVGAGVFADNPGSRRVLEKLGFRRVGGYALHCRSRNADVAVDDMNLARDAWESRSREMGRA